MAPQTALKFSTKTDRCAVVSFRCASTRNRLCVFFACVLLFPVGFIYYSFGVLKGGHILKSGDWARATKQYPACPIPQLEPFHESIRDLVDNKELPSSFNCEASYTILFNSTRRSTIVPAKGPDYFREGPYESCCYQKIGRYVEGIEPLDDYHYISKECFPLSFTNETKIPTGHEFIAIFCKGKGNPKEILVDVHAFVHLKRRLSGGKTEERREKFNVVIFGVDSMSRMNFLRTMPQSYSFLKNEMGAVEMFGYNKVGDHTPPNIMPLLMSGMPQESNCFNGWYLDDCPFIWKEYSKRGYNTMSSEDGSSSALLRNNMGLGFNRQPTDYYPRPLLHYADSAFNQYTCYGPRLTFQFLLDYMEKFVSTMSRNNKNFFQFTWASALTHDYMNGALLGDPHLEKSLRWMKESGHLNNTILILMSDHGARLGEIRNRIQGQLEDRLPFLYFVFPESFKTKYKKAYRNLLYNADKLVTTFDLHESLKDIPNLDMIGKGKLLRREHDLSRLGRNLTRGISLFLPIPEFRTCEMAGITMNFCSCNHVELVKMPNPEINAVAKIAVSHINSILVNSTSLGCAVLDLHDVSMAWRTGRSADKWDGYTINFETKPGEAKFEAMVLKANDSGVWKVQDPIARTNRCGNQSHCVQNVKLKPYCYCLE